MAERIKRTTNTHAALDLTKPIDTKAITPKDEGDCFGREWAPDHKMCSVCAEAEVCGILYNSRQSKLVKKLEKDKGGYLDNMHFDSIDKEDLLEWLRIKPRTTQQLYDKIAKFSKCPDDTTVVYWIKSFLLERKHILTTKGGNVIFK